MARHKRWLLPLAIIQLGLVAAIVALTNTEVPQRVELLLFQDRPGTLIVTAVFWGLATISLLAILAHSSTVVRLFWAVVVSVSGAVAWGFQDAAKLELSIFDFLSFWEARHEVGRAAALYGQSFIWAGFIACAGIIAFALPFVSEAIGQRRFKRFTAILPVLPVIAIAALVYEKQGQGYFAMPKQFSQVSLAGLTAVKIALNAPKPREALLLKPKFPGSSEKILFLVDESIRPDYLNALPGNLQTPGFASFAQYMVDFGPAASGGICSNYSNAILRFAASRSDLGSKINTNPTLWQYAKAAGYRTVYIDAQAGNVKNSSQLQNFMTLDELQFVDQVYRMSDVEPKDADFQLLDILEKELSAPGPVFIYANKQGAHFPYEMNYDTALAADANSQGKVAEITTQSIIGTYRNAINRNVDQFFAKLSKQLPLNNLSLVYTSDHGQYFEQGVATHCVASGAQPQMALVPLYAFSSIPNIQLALRQGAEKSVGRANHFQIAPTLMEWMGFDQQKIGELHPESLTRGTSEQPFFSHGDVFGIFIPTVEMQAIDLGRNYLEKAAEEAKNKTAAASLGQAQ
jgi:glucan phosphoethanolaminetransferase (alkaline phosphatase superfamily)